MTVSSPSHSPRLHRPDSEPSLPARRRAIWRQRLIDAEGGLRIGLRANSTLHVHLFLSSAVAITGVVLGLSFLEWLLLFAAFAATMGAELFHQALQALASTAGGTASYSVRQALRLSTAATLTIVAGSTLVATAVLARRLWLLFS